MALKEVSLVAFLTVLALLTAVQATEKEDLLSGTLKVIFSNIFKANFMSVSIIVNISGPESFKLSQEILDKVMRINKSIQVPVAINQYTAINLEHCIHAKLIFTNSAKNLKIHMDNIFKNNKIEINISIRYIVVLSAHGSMRKTFIEMHTIFQDFFNLYIIDVVILVHDADALNMYTYKPYSNKQCAFTKPILLQRFEKVSEFILYNDLFPVKTNNFHQCPMKVVLWDIPPFMKLLYINNSVYFKGFDAEILRDLATFFNFSIEIIPNNPQTLIAGEVFKNNTATGVFKLLLERKANLTIGYISCTPRRLQLTTGSSPYFFSEVVIIFKNSKRYTPFQVLLRPFTKSTWSFIITILMLRLIFKRILFRNLQLSSSFRKLFKLLWLLLIFFLRISYEGSIFQALSRTPFQQLPLTIDEVVQQNYSLITDYANARVLEEITLLKNITTIVPGNPQTVLESIDDLPLKTGILSCDTLVAIFMKSRLSNYSRYAIVREKVSNTLSCIFFPRLSFMAPMVNSLLKQYSMFGIFHKYTKELGLENLPMTTDRFRKRYSLNPRTPLDLVLLRSVFGCFAVMNSLAVLVFILELLSLHCKFLKFIFKKVFGC